MANSGVKVLAMAASGCLLAACSTTGADRAAAAPSGSGSATARLMTASGQPVGQAVATERSGGVEVTLTAMGMPPGVHGAHVHTTGRCDAPDFTTAGGHWNPTMKQHGTENPQGPHAGDFPNVTIAADGSGTLTMMLPAGTMVGLLDADGSAFVVHAAADDNRTDPSGNSGGRIACGVFQRS